MERRPGGREGPGLVTKGGNGRVDSRGQGEGEIGGAEETAKVYPSLGKGGKRAGCQENDQVRGTGKRNSPVRKEGT